MKFKNYEVKPLYELLMSVELSGKKSRMRTRFCKILADRIKLIDEERLEIIKSLSEIDEKGNPKTEKNEEEGTIVYVMSDENKSKFIKEYNDLLEEDYYIEETEERRDVLTITRDVILDLDIPMSGQNALLYDRYCEVFEEIKAY